MLIRKMFSFEGAHVVRNCSTERCAFSIHGHSYKVEVLLHADALDHGQMVYDFSLLKNSAADIVDAFDHTLVFWRDDDASYIESCKQNSLRWIGLPVSPSAEQLSRTFFVLIDQALRGAVMKNGEHEIKLESVIVHETATGYAQCFRRDAYNPAMGLIHPAAVEFSPRIVQEAGGPIVDGFDCEPHSGGAC